MAIETRRSEEAVSTPEWYDFVALVADLVPAIHAGGEAATTALLEMLRLEAGERVLDVGCGSGATAIRMARDLGTRVTGIDLSAGMIVRAQDGAARPELVGRLEFLVGDARNLPFQDGDFDAVLFESVLTVVPADPGQALAEMARVCRPGGRIGGNEGTAEGGLCAKLEPVLARHPAIRRVYAQATLRGQFEAAGLAAIETQESEAGAVPALNLARLVQERGAGRLLSFCLRSYPRLAWRLVTDRRLRHAHHADEALTRCIHGVLGYTLMVGWKPR